MTVGNRTDKEILDRLEIKNKKGTKAMFNRSIKNVLIDFKKIELDLLKEELSKEGEKLLSVAKEIIGNASKEQEEVYKNIGLLIFSTQKES